MQQKSLLNRFDFTMIVVSLVIGMGIFRTPVNVARAVDTPALFYATWIAGGIVALCGALTYAEIGSRFPVTGGYYKIFSYAYHPSVAFGVNCIILISNAASLAGVAIIGSEYITKVIAPTATANNALRISIAIASVVLFYGINLAGLKMSARTQNILTLIKLAMIVLLITPLFFSTAVSIPSIESTAHPTSWISYLKGFGIGLVAVSFTYGGYQQTINFGAEVQQPSKNVPRGIFMGILIIVSLYLIINYAYIKVIGFQQLKTAEGIAAIMASHVFGDAAANILSVFLFLSVLAYVNVLLMSNPRVMAAMSEDGILPPSFAIRTVNRQVLFTSLSVFASLCVLIIFWAETFDSILSFTIFLDCIGMVLSAGSIFRLRKKTAHLNGTGIYEMKWYPVLPILFMLAYVFVAVSIAADFQANHYAAVKGLLVLATFMALFFATRFLSVKK